MKKDFDEQLFTSEMVKMYISRKKLALFWTIGTGIAAAACIIVMLVFCKEPISIPFMSAALGAIASSIFCLTCALGYFSLKKWLAKFELPKKDENEKSK